MTEEIRFCTEYTLPSDMEAEASRRAIEENPANAQQAEGAGRGLELASVTAKRWKPGRTLNIHFMNGDDFLRGKVEEMARKWLDYVNLEFRFDASAAASQIRIAFTPGAGSASYIGTDALLQPSDRYTMHFGWFDHSTSDDEFERTTVHEFGHALSFIHEHQNPAVDIPWDKPAVYRYYAGPNNYWDKSKVDNNLFRKYSVGITNYSDFDKDSIMCYPIPNSLTIGDYQVGWNKKLSALDKKFAAEWYPRT